MPVGAAAGVVDVAELPDGVFGRRVGGQVGGVQVIAVADGAVHGGGLGGTVGIGEVGAVRQQPVQGVVSVLGRGVAGVNAGLEVAGRVEARVVGDAAVLAVFLALVAEAVSGEARAIGARAGGAVGARVFDLGELP